jgi:glycogen(starch) synthase
MNILLMTSSYFPHKGGVETVVSDLASGISAHGDNVIVVTNLWPSSLPLIDVVNKVVVIRVPMVLPSASNGIRTRVKGVITNILLTLLMVVFRPSLINIQCVGPNGYWGKRLSKRFNVPIVVSTHGERTNDSSGFYSVPQNEETYEELIHLARAVICVSEVSSRESLHDLGIASDKIAIIPNAISVNKQPNDTANRVIDITYVGRLVPEKGVDILIKAVTNLCKSFSGLTVNIVGDGPSMDPLKKAVIDSELCSNVLFTGQLDQVAVKKVLLTSKILVLPSRKESFGLVLLEAANAGCAVVATATGGIPSIIENGVNGLLFDIDADNQLQEHLANLLSDELLRQELVCQFWNRLSQYDVTNFVTRYRAVFADATT